MQDVVLSFADGVISGEGYDCIGRFEFRGNCDPQGVVVMLKQYVGSHQVLYQGQYDGEGTMFGHWTIGPVDSGEFLLSLASEEGASTELAELFRPSAD
jgi:hypothetical protein